MNADSRKIALLIDGDNAQPSLVDQVLAETAKHGVVTTRRIYGDWTSPQMSSWKDCLHSHAIQPIQQFRYTVGKNATDSSLIIEAMDLLHYATVDGFCIVSSDSDYTRLATRIREQGLFVMGIGRSDTPKSFVNACEIFVYTEILSPQKAEATRVAGTFSTEWTDNVTRAIEMATRDDGWAFLGAVGNYLRQLDPSFDSRNYGHNQFSALVRSQPELFETRESKMESGPSIIDVRLVA